MTRTALTVAAAFALTALAAPAARAQTGVHDVQYTNYFIDASTFSPSHPSWDSGAPPVSTATIVHGQTLQVSGTLEWKQNYPAPTYVRGWVGGGGYGSGGYPTGTYYSASVTLTNVRVGRPGSFGIDPTYKADFVTSVYVGNPHGWWYCGVDFFNSSGYFMGTPSSNSPDGSLCQVFVN